nr:hypothetical protein BaRGS_031061 [Batillaria attramentaria]
MTVTDSPIGWSSDNKVDTNAGSDGRGNLDQLKLSEEILDKLTSLEERLISLEQKMTSGDAECPCPQTLEVRCVAEGTPAPDIKFSSPEWQLGAGSEYVTLTQLNAITTQADLRISDPAILSTRSYKYNVRKMLGNQF